MPDKTKSKVEKSLKRNRFDLFDAAYACICFIVLQIVFDLIMLAAGNGIRKYFGLAVLMQILVEAVFFISTVIVACSRRVDIVRATTMNKKLNWQTALLCVAISIITIYAFNALSNVFILSLEKLGYKPYLSDFVIPNFGWYIFYVIIMCVIPAFCEDMLFRGTILRGMMEKNKTYAVFMSALIFCLMHGGPDQTIHQFILGVILGYVLVYSGTVWAPVLIHFLNNFIAVTIMYIAGTGSSEATPLPSWGELAGTLVIGLAFAALGGYLVYLCIMAMKRSYERDKNFRDQKFLALLGKETLTAEEIKWLKKYKKLTDEEKLDKQSEAALLEENKVGEVIVDVAVSQVETTQQENAGQNPNEAKVQPKQKKKTSVGYIVMLTISLVYLCVSWILTLISGFLG